MANGDGDGWVELEDGTRRWGRYGAAGLLLYGLDAAGQDRILLQRRVWWSHQGGTWGVPGGARDSTESSLAAAVREFTEEIRPTDFTAQWGPDALAGQLSPVGIHRQDHGRWSYDTVLARLPGCLPLRPGSRESTAVEWVPVADVANRNLHPGFAGVWPLLHELLTARPALIVDAAAVAAMGDHDHGEPTGADVARLHQELRALSNNGLAAELLPEVLREVRLRHWYPAVRLVVSGQQPDGLAEAPNDDTDDSRRPVTVVMPERTTSQPDLAATLRALVKSTAGPSVVVTTDPEVAQHCAALGAHVRPPEWLTRALSANATR